MAALTVQVVTRAGLEPELVPADVAGDTFANTGQEWVEVVNGGGAPIVATVTPTATIDGQDAAARDVTVPAGERRMIGPFPQQFYSDGSGNVLLECSPVTDVMVGAFRLAPV